MNNFKNDKIIFNHLLIFHVFIYRDNSIKSVTTNTIRFQTRDLETKHSNAFEEKQFSSTRSTRIIFDTRAMVFQIEAYSESHKRFQPNGKAMAMILFFIDINVFFIYLFSFFFFFETTAFVTFFVTLS